MSKTFAERLREDRRLVMLRLLSEQPGFRLNTSNLHAGLQHIGVAASRDDVLTDVHWLKDQGMVVLEPIPEVANLYLCRLTTRGEDVAHDRARVPGISHPSPK